MNVMYILVVFISSCTLINEAIKGLLRYTNVQQCSNGQSRSCGQLCVGKVNYNQCLSQCSNENTRLGVLIGGSVGGVFGLAILIFLIVMCVKSHRCERLRQRIRRNNVDLTKMSEQKFYLQKKYFQSLLEDTLNRKTFQFIPLTDKMDTERGEETKIIEVIEFEFFPQKQFIYKFYIQAKDYMGEWDGEGYFLVASTGIQVWWMKYYQQTQKLGELPNCVIFEGGLSEQKIYLGKWYFQGYQNHPQYSGKWSLFKRGNKLDNSFTTLNELQNVSKRHNH